TLGGLASDTFSEIAQDNFKATLAPKLTRQNAIIDWNNDAGTIANQIRGLYPWPGCKVGFGSHRDAFTLIRAVARDFVPQDDEWREQRGTINKEGLVLCANGLLQILELKPESKQPMTLEAYRNGHPWPAGSRLQSAL